MVLDKCFVISPIRTSRFLYQSISSNLSLEMTLPSLSYVVMVPVSSVSYSYFFTYSRIDSSIYFSLVVFFVGRSLLKAPSGRELAP